MAPRNLTRTPDLSEGSRIAGRKVLIVDHTCLLDQATLARLHAEGVEVLYPLPRLPQRRHRGEG